MAEGGTVLRRREFGAIVLAGAALTLAWGARADDQPPTVDFQRDVRPILESHCVKCHGVEQQKSGLRLDTLKAALAGGDSGPAIQPGKSGESLLVEAILGAEGIAKMPPKAEPQLSPDQIERLKQWIDAGARGE